MAKLRDPANAGDYMAVTRHPWDGCQYNPIEHRGALVIDQHFRETPATVLVGGPGQGTINYRLCARCAALPTFSDKFGRRQRTRIRPGSPKP